MKKNSPLVSIVIVNWNGREYLEKCLSSLSQISYKPIEVIVVDQNSSDGSQSLIKRKYPKVLLIENKDNTGYVGGNNAGASQAKGKYLLILNNDIEVTKDFLEPLVYAFESDQKLGCAQPKAINLRFRKKLDGAGSLFTATGFLYHRGYLEKDGPEYNLRCSVYSVKGAYMMTRLALYRKLGGLDPDFFIYFEETDYCARVWIAGYKVEYIPESIVYHWGGSDTLKDWKNRFVLVQYRSFKNRICSYIKTLSIERLIYVTPIHLIISEALSFYYLIFGMPKTFVAIQRAILLNIVNIQKTLEKRSKIQMSRRSSDGDIFSKVSKNVSPAYYIEQLKILRK